MTSEQTPAQELIDKYRKQESLKSAIGQCCSELVNCDRALIIQKLPGEKCLPDELTERINSMESKVEAIIGELQELAILIDVAQADTKQDIAELTEGGVQ